jgi:hypothetical protein
MWRKQPHRFHTAHLLHSILVNWTVYLSDIEISLKLTLFVCSKIIETFVTLCYCWLAVIYALPRLTIIFSWWCISAACLIDDKTINVWRLSPNNYNSSAWILFKERVIYYQPFKVLLSSCSIRSVSFFRLEPCCSNSDSWPSRLVTIVSARLL